MTPSTTRFYSQLSAGLLAVAILLTAACVILGVVLAAGNVAGIIEAIGK